MEVCAPTEQLTRTHVHALEFGLDLCAIRQDAAIIQLLVKMGPLAITKQLARLHVRVGPFGLELFVIRQDVETTPVYVKMEEFATMRH